MLNANIPRTVPAPLRIYVAGPLSAANADGIRENVRIASTFAAELQALGHRTFTPHLESGHHCTTTPTDAEYVRWVEDFDYGWIRVCDALFLIPGWEQSKGSRMEREYAEALKLWIFEEVPDVPRVVLNPLASHMLERRDAFSRECRQRLILGGVKYGDDWTYKDKLVEAIPELMDRENYPFLDALRIERQIALRDGKPWPPEKAHG
jgi:hypothetical protein